MGTPLEQLEAMRSVRANWDGYGADPPLPVAIDMAKGFVSLVESIRRDVDVFPVLYTTPTRVGGVMLVWEDREFEYELEIEPDGLVELLQESKATKQIEIKLVLAAPNQPVPTVIDGK
jgi:hypothetical protein